MQQYSHFEIPTPISLHIDSGYRIKQQNNQPKNIGDTQRQTQSVVWIVAKVSEKNNYKKIPSERKLALFEAQQRKRTHRRTGPQRALR